MKITIEQKDASQILLGILASVLLAIACVAIFVCILFLSCNFVALNPYVCIFNPSFMFKAFAVAFLVATAMFIILSAIISKINKQKKPTFAKSLFGASAVIIILPTAFYISAFLWSWFIQALLKIHP